MAQPPPLSTNLVLAGAGFWIRALARTIDLVFGLVLGLFGGIVGAIVLVILQAAGSISPGWQQRIHGMSVASFGLSLLGVLLYHSFCEGVHGASVGKLMCGLRVLQQDGQPSNMKGAVIRSLAWFIDSLFFGAVRWTSMAKSPLRQRYGDVWGRTIVVKTKDIPASSGRSVLRLLGGVCLGAACWLLLLVLGLFLKAR